MMVIDKLSELIGSVLALLPQAARPYLAVPLLVLTVVVVLWIVVRRLLAPIGTAAAVLLRWLTLVIGALLLVPDAMTATTLRRAGVRPPEMLYLYGDTIASIGSRICAALATGGASLTRAAKMNLAFILILAALPLWYWNHGQCTGAETAAGCVRPMTQWFTLLTK